MALTSMETKFCKLPLDFGALLSEDVENSRLASCTEIESIDQFIEMLIDTAPGEHAFDKDFGCEIFYLDHFAYPLGRAVFRLYHPSHHPVREASYECERPGHYRRYHSAGQCVRGFDHKKTRAGICLWQSGAYRREALFLLCDLFRTHFNPMTSV